MTWLQGYDIPKIVTTVSVLIALTMLLVREVSRSRRRAHQLRMARTMLVEHYQLTEKLLSDPETPDFVIDVINSMLKGFADRSTANEITDILCNLDTPTVAEQVPEGMESFKADMDDFRQNHPALFSDFVAWFMKGSIVAMLRWPETSVKLDARMMRVTTDTHKEEQFASTVTSRIRNKMGTMSGTALPA